MVFIWVDQGIREPYVPKIRHLPLTNAAPIHEDIAPGEVEIHEESELPVSYEYRKAVKAYQNTVREGEAALKKILYARDIMSTDVLTLPFDGSLNEAEILFNKKRFRHIPVVREGVLAGVISDRDILRIKLEFPDDFILMSIEKVMKKKVLTARPETNIRDVARVMLEERIGSMIILDHDGHIAGIITRTDILRSIVKHASLELWG